MSAGVHFLKFVLQASVACQMQLAVRLWSLVAHVHECLPANMTLCCDLGTRAPPACCRFTTLLPFHQPASVPTFSFSDVDNLQTIKSSTLNSLQQLPENLRSLLTRSIARPAGGLPRIATAASIGAAAAAGAVAGASVHAVGSNLPHSPGAVAAAAAPRALRASRRPTSGSTPTKGPQLLASTVSPRKPAEGPAPVPSGASAPALFSIGSASADVLAALLSQDKPPVPRRTSSSRSLRAKMADVRRQGSEALRVPLLESEQEGECSGSPWPAAQQAQQAQHEAQHGRQPAEGLEALLKARQDEQIRRMLSPPPGTAGADGDSRAAGGSGGGDGGLASSAAQGRPRRVSWEDRAPQQAQQDGSSAPLHMGSPFAAARPGRVAASEADEPDLEAQQAQQGQQAQQQRAQRRVGWQE